MGHEHATRLPHTSLLPHLRTLPACTAAMHHLLRCRHAPTVTKERAKRASHDKLMSSAVSIVSSKRSSHAGSSAKGSSVTGGRCVRAFVVGLQRAAPHGAHGHS